MGIIYYTENSMRQKVTIKLIRDELRHNPDCILRLQHEIKTLIALEGHPNIVTIKSSAFSTDSPVFIMEYLDDEDLYSYVKRTKSAIDDPTLDNWAALILHALQHAHDKGIIHRDIKPATSF